MRVDTNEHELWYTSKQERIQTITRMIALFDTRMNINEKIQADTNEHDGTRGVDTNGHEWKLVNMSKQEYH